MQKLPLNLLLLTSLLVAIKLNDLRYFYRCFVNLLALLLSLPLSGIVTMATVSCYIATFSSGVSDVLFFVYMRLVLSSLNKALLNSVSVISFSRSWFCHRA